jgi:hypothetical protein
MVEKRNFAKFASAFAREAALERPSAVSNADPDAEDEGVAAVEGDSWLDVDGSRRVLHVISGESPTSS